MNIVNEYKIKPGITIEDILAELKEKEIPYSEGGSYVHKDSKYVTWFGIGHETTANIGFPEDLLTWDSYDHVLVLDEMFGQPYYPFYQADEDENKRFPAVLNCIGNYNKQMSKFNFLERI